MSRKLRLVNGWNADCPKFGSLVRSGVLVWKGFPHCVSGNMRVMLWVIVLVPGNTGVKQRGFNGWFSCSVVPDGSDATVADIFRCRGAVSSSSSKVKTCCC